MGYEHYDPMCSCASCNYERDNERQPMNNAFRAIALLSGVMLYLASYFAGSLPLVLGTSLLLGALILSVSQLRNR
jgi:VIT1/CCC1 family predicted Fe2+/Mn2+ transporter